VSLAAEGGEVVLASSISVFGLCYSGNAALLVTFFSRLLSEPLIAIRTIVGALVLNLLGRKSNPCWWEEIRKDPKSSFILAFTGILASGGLFYVGLKLTSASNAGILAATTPIWVTVLSWMFLGEKLKLVNVTGVVLSCFGLVVIIYQGSLANLLQRSFN